MKKLLLLSIILTFVVSNTAYAIVSTVPTAATSNLSLKAAVPIVASGAGVAAVGVNNKSWFGTLVGGLIAGGGIAIGIIDPPSNATFYSGEFAVHYPDELLTPMISGWLGSWGEDPTLVPPPVNVSDWGNPGSETVFTMQNPNAALNANISNANGLQTVTFDWGSAGHPESSTDPFNFFATQFTVNADVKVEYLGDFMTAPDGANFYVTVADSGIQCIPSNEKIIQKCGEATTSYYSIVKVPEPSSLVLLFVGALALMGARRYR